MNICRGWLWLVTLPVAMAGIQSFDFLLPPTEEYVRYHDGYIRAPGFVDLGDLTFTAETQSFLDEDDEYDVELVDDGEYDDGVYADEEVFDNDDGSIRRVLEGGVEKDATVVDIAIFRLPRACVHSRKGCDWANLGVGKRSEDGRQRYCCSQEAIDLGICTGGDDYGRLMIDEDKFSGSTRFVTVPPEGAMSKNIQHGKVDQLDSGTYVVLYANCNARGRQILVTGESVWKSKHGFLPGELYGFMLFYTSVTLVYFGLLGWFGVHMYVHEENRIEIEKWIFFAIVLGLMEMIFRTGDYYVWNADGYRSNIIIWVGVLAGVLKQGMSRCLIVMVSLGWGVVRDSLGDTMVTIVVLGSTYIVLSSVRDLMMVYAIEDMTKLSINEEETIFGVVRILTLIVSALDVIFILWILDALNNTMLYLENMGQSRKLERYLKFRCLFMISILFASAWAVMTLVDSGIDEGILEEEHAWAIDAATEVNYLFVLVGVAYLWKPNPNAKAYAYVMELPAMGADGENELELSGTVPSAMDSDDGSDIGAAKNGFHDDNSNDDGGRFQIS